MSISLKCLCDKEEFQIPETFFEEFKWPKCSCDKPFIILGVESELSDTPLTNRKSVVSTRNTTRSKKR